MKRIEFVSFEEFQKLHKAEKDNKMKLIYSLAFGGGLRLSEIIGLREELSPCCNALLEIKREKEEGRTLKKKYCSKCNQCIPHNKIKRSKTQWRIPPLEKERVNLVTHQIQLDIAKGGKWRITVTPPNLREPQLSLLPITIPRRTVQARFEALTKKVLKKKLSIHILRHGFGNYHANVLKTPLPIVQQLMGHSRLDTTGIYTKANPEFAIQEAWKGMMGE